MIKVHVTKKLLAKLPLNEDGFLPAPTKIHYSEEKKTQLKNPLSHWHANLLVLQRRNCILMLHDATRFPVFIPCLKKPDFAQLDYQFANAYMNTILKAGFSEKLMETADQYLAPICCDADTNRSVLGTMNQMKSAIENMLWYDHVSVSEITGYRVGAWLADTPCTVKGQKNVVWPQQAMQELLTKNSLPRDSIPGQAESPLPDNVIALDKYR